MNPLQTQRLTIRQLTFADAPFILELVNTPGWIKYIGDRKIHSIADAENYLRLGPIASYAKNNFGLCMVERTEDRRQLGICGLLLRDYLPFPDLGFAFLPDSVGNGYAFEAAETYLSEMKSTFGFETIQAITTPHNERSIALLLKLGFRLEGKLKDPGTNDDLSLFVMN